MNRLYVAWQDDSSREWIPVAKLERNSRGYFLSYTQGVKRCTSFMGLGRMTALDKVYFSETLFPFFANRLISKSRPEYRKYLEWLGLDEITDDPMSVMSVTGGIRATDSFELIPPPHKEGNEVKIDFFPRGLRHLPAGSHERISSLQTGDRLYLMMDIQNGFDPNAIGLRTDDPKALVGYLAKYYCSGLIHVLQNSANDIKVTVKRVNKDAPFDMRLLCTLTATSKEVSLLIESEGDFSPLSLESVTQSLSSTIGADGIALDLI